MPLFTDNANGLLTLFKSSDNVYWQLFWLINKYFLIDAVYDYHQLYADIFDIV